MKIQLFFLLLLLFSCHSLMTPIAGNFDGEPGELALSNDLKVQALLKAAYNGINTKCLSDLHIHVAGTGQEGSGIWVNPKMRSLTSPFKYLQMNAYMSAAKIDNIDNADHEYANRVFSLIDSLPHKGLNHFMAFDYHYDNEGNRVEEKTTFYVPNEYIWKLTQENPKNFRTIISVHPYRKDAVEELEKWGKKGIKFIKWLPNAMNIDPSKPELDSYYETVKKYDMAILTHTGHEKAVDGEEYQHLANPLLLRRPLDKGVKIIMAHLASLGECKDLDNNNKMVPCFDLFWRMFKNPKYEKNMFGEISAVTLHTRLGKPLLTVLEHPEYHHRLVNGSDYPLPAINILYRTGQLLDQGYITKMEREILNKVYKKNPMLFDFLLKRTLKHPSSGRKLLPEVFELPKSLGCHS